MKSLGKEFVSGIIWSLLGNLGLVGLTFVTNIILAKKIDPSEFGQIAIVMFFIVLVNIIAKGGMGGALVRSPTASKLDYSTLFVFNTSFAILGALFLILLSNQIADYYKDEDIGLLVRWCSLLPIVNALYFINLTKMTRDLSFKKINIFQFWSLLISSLLGVILAFLGYGAFAIIVIQLTNSVFLTFFFSLEKGFYFSLNFSKVSFKKLFSFGVNTTLVNLLNTGFDNIYSLIIGKYFNISQVGFFYQAKKLQQVPTEILNSLSQKVVFASLSKIQEDRERFNRFYFKIISLFTVAVAFIIYLIYVYSDLVIIALYDDKWLGAIPLLKLLVLSTFFYILEQFNRVVFKVFDKTDQLLKLEVLKKTFQTFSIVIGVIYNSLEVLLIGLIVVYFISYCINLVASRKILVSSVFTELKLVFLIIGIIVFIFFIIKLFENFFDIEGFKRLLFLPAALLFYVFLIQIAGIVNWKSDFKFVKNLINKT